MKFLTSLYLSSASQLNVACFMMSLPISSTTFCFLSLLSILAATMACTAALAALATGYGFSDICLLSYHLLSKYFLLYLV